MALVASASVALGASCEAPQPIEEASEAEEPVGPFSAREYASVDRLVTTAWVEARLEDPDVITVDLRAREAYDQGHVPGAAHLPPRETFQAEDDQGVPGMLPAPEALAASLGAIGVTPETTIVLYDDAANLWSARGLWALTVHGHADARLMDGAWTSWVSEERPVSTRSPAREPAGYAFSSEPDTSIVAGWSDVVAAIDDPESLVCDARSDGEYGGVDVRAAQGGHVPGARHVEWSRAVDASGAFRPANELRALYSDAGVTDGKTTFTMCQSGVRAAHTWFVLTDLLGYDNVRVYDGSWVEYGNRDDSPIEDPSIKS